MFQKYTPPRIRVFLYTCVYVCSSQKRCKRCSAWSEPLFDGAATVQQRCSHGAATGVAPRFCAGRRPACPNPTRPFVRNCGNPFGQKPPLTRPFVRNVRKPLQTETASDLGFCAEPKIQKPPLTWAFVRNS